MSEQEKEAVLREQEGQQTVDCNVCRKEVPASAARSAEGEDYVHHFCGAECLEQWNKEKKEDA